MVWLIILYSIFKCRKRRARRSSPFPPSESSPRKLPRTIHQKITSPSAGKSKRKIFTSKCHPYIRMTSPSRPSSKKIDHFINCRWGYSRHFKRRGKGSWLRNGNCTWRKVKLWEIAVPNFQNWRNIWPKLSINCCWELQKYSNRTVAFLSIGLFDQVAIWTSVKLTHRDTIALALRTEFWTKDNLKLDGSHPIKPCYRLQL